jgi:hypothetical protein
MRGSSYIIKHNIFIYISVRYSLNLASIMKLNMDTRESISPILKSQIHNIYSFFIYMHSKKHQLYFNLIDMLKNKKLLLF